MSETNDGGPAFPTHQHVGFTTSFSGGYSGPIVAPVGGMSLRDYFAAKAIYSLAQETSFSEAMLAEWAYRLADAMLVERTKATGDTP